MSLQQILDLYSIDKDVTLINKFWTKYSNSLTDDKLFFLDKKYIVAASKYLNFEPEWIDEAVNTAELIAQNELFKSYAWVCHNILVNETYDPELFHALKQINDYTVKDFAFFHVITLISGLDFIKQQYMAKGIPQNILLDTLSTMNSCIRDYSNKEGRIAFNHLSWNAQHFHLKIFKLGRLEYQFYQYKFPNYCFQNQTQQYLVLSGDRLEYRSDGQFNGTNNIFDDNAWKSQFSETRTTYSGNPISPSGKAINKTVVLNKTDWTMIAQSDTPILALHIPASGSLSVEICNESFKTAVDFFATYYPEYNYNIFSCDSWLLDNQYPEYLAESSNIRQFSSEFYLFPTANANSAQTYQRVFQSEAKAINELPQNSSLQKSMVEFLKSGRCFRSGGGFIFKENNNFGSNNYRKAWKSL
jgi:hypothetical protein